jgi:hypothetical protein
VVQGVSQNQGLAPAGGQVPGGQAPGVPFVPGPTYPSGVTPNWTQFPASPYTGYPPPGFPAPPGMGAGPQASFPAQPGYPAQGFGPTYPGNQPFMRVPGPATLGPGPQGSTAAGNNVGGVAGVSMAPITTVAPPAGTGGPHPLPSLPQVPLPQGFPNPFAIQQAPVGPQQGQSQPGGPAPQGAPPGVPGLTTVTGPVGYLPGLGYFGTPNGPGAAPLPGPFGGAYPALPQQPAQGAQTAPPPTAFPVLPGAIHQQSPQPQYAFPQNAQPQYAMPQPRPQGAVPPAQPQPQQAAAQPNPFWLQLAWQLVQTPAVKSVLGDRADRFVEGEGRLPALQIAASCLAGPELQQALKGMTSGGLDQNRFIALFAEVLARALDTQG